MIKTMFLFFGCLVALSAMASAETRYVTDMLIVTVRDNPSDNFQSLESLATAAPVEILAEDPIFVKVRTQKGTEGYIRKQYISPKTPKSLVIARLQHEVGQLQEQLATQTENCQEQSEAAGSGQARIEALSGELKTSRQQLEKISKEFEQLKERSKNVVDLTSEREQLAEENNRLASELGVLREENKSFHRSNMIQWFLAGAGVFLGGWLVGKISRRKRGFNRL
jgi:SH3 domain protein